LGSYRAKLGHELGIGQVRTIPVRIFSLTQVLLLSQETIDHPFRRLTWIVLEILGSSCAKFRPTQSHTHPEHSITVSKRMTLETRNDVIYCDTSTVLVQ
jgi:hypothetical protein